MTIDKAIKLLNIAKEGWPVDNVEKYYKALELGIEALKRIQKNREGIFRHNLIMLPGETEEVKSNKSKKQKHNVKH